VGRIDDRSDTYLSWVLLVGMAVVAAWLILASYGCSAASWVVHHNPPASDLLVTEADVDEVIEGLSKGEPADPEAVLYNRTTDRYELKPETYKRALRDGIMRRAQDKKIEEFLEDYRPETFGGALKRDLGTAGIVVILLGVLAGLFY
jgi:hypothetical protein